MFLCFRVGDPRRNKCKLEKFRFLVVWPPGTARSWGASETGNTLELSGAHPWFTPGRPCAANPGLGTRESGWVYASRGHVQYEVSWAGCVRTPPAWSRWGPQGTQLGFGKSKRTRQKPPDSDCLSKIIQIRIANKMKFWLSWSWGSKDILISDSIDAGNSFSCFVSFYFPAQSVFLFASYVK